MSVWRITIVEIWTIRSAPGVLVPQSTPTGSIVMSQNVTEEVRCFMHINIHMIYYYNNNIK